jgi:hypothetical protein
VDRLDFYKFSLTGTNNISLQLSGVTDNYLYAKIYYDSNNNDLIDSGDELYSNYAGSSRNAQINTTLGAGNYYIGISRDSSNVNSNYSLQLSAISAPASIASNPGNTLGTAYNIGTLSGTQTITEFVGSVDRLDFYKFSLTGTNNISLQLSGVTDNYLYAKLYYDSNNNGLIDSGEQLNSDYAGSSRNALITRTLGAGNYYIGISQDSSNVNSNYSLTLVNITNPNPNITLAVSTGSVTEDGTGNLVYTFSRTGGTANALTVNYEITGTADSTDYTGATSGISKTITFAAGASTATLTIDPTADSIIEPDETVSLTLTSGTDYTIGTATAVTGTIANDDVFTPIESAGNTKLVKDTTNKYFTQIGTNNPTAIKNGGQQIYQDIYGSGWQTIAAETVNGVNQVLWKNITGNYLHIWRLDSNWNWVSSEGQFGLNSADAFTQETNFGIDTNGDGVIGNPYTAIESAGNTKLVKDSTNKYSTQIGTNNPIAIKNGGQQIYQDIYGSGWQTIAAETVNGVNQVLWKNITGNYLHIWHLDSNWNWVSSEGQFGLNSADAFTQETNFGIDANSDGVIGNPASNPYILIEAAGNTKLVKDPTNKYFSQIGTNNPTAIKNGGQQIYQDIYGSGWQTIAAETVNGDNQVLWKNTAGNFLHIWHLDNNWNWVSSEGNWGLNSADAFTQETNFGIDANADGIIGNPYTSIESTGNTKLVKDTANKYFAQVGTATPIAIQNSGVQIFPDIYPGWQTLAVETVNGDNQVLWKNVSGNYLHIWHLDNSWNRVSSEGQFGLNSADAFTQETNFGIDGNGDGIIGNPYIAIV